MKKISAKTKLGLIFGLLALLLVGVFISNQQLETLQAAPKTAQKGDKKTKKVKNEEKTTEQKKQEELQAQQAQQMQQLAKSITPIVLEPVENEYGLKATPIPLILKKETDTFPNLSTAAGQQKVVKDVVNPYPDETLHYAYCDASGAEVSIPNINEMEIGFYSGIYVKIWEEWTHTPIIVNVPVSIIDTADVILPTASNPQVIIQSNTTNGKIVLYPDETFGKTETEIESVVKQKADSKAWNVENGDSLPVSVSQTTVPNNTVGSGYTATLSVPFGTNENDEPITLTTNKEVIVFGAIAQNYFTLTKGSMLSVSTNPTNLFSKFQTFSNATATNATYQLVDSQGEPLVQFDSSEIGFKWAYIRMTEKNNADISTVLRVPVSITETSSTADITTTNMPSPLANKVMVAATHQVILYPNETKGKSKEQLLDLIRSKMSIKGWNMQDGSDVPVSLSDTTVQNDTVGSWTVTLKTELGEQSATTTRTVTVFGASIKSPYYFSVKQGDTLDMGTNGATFFNKWQTFSTTTASNATYTWVDENGNEISKYNSNEAGFHPGYIKMTEKNRPEISTIIEIPISVLAPGMDIVNGQIAIGISNTLISASQIEGKNGPQILELLQDFLSPKAWDVKSGEPIDVEVTATSVRASTRGQATVTMEAVRTSISKTFDVLVTPADVWKEVGMEGWIDLPKGSTEGQIVNPINGSRAGFPARGINNSRNGNFGVAPAVLDGEGYGFVIQDSNGAGYIYGGYGASDIPAVNGTPLYRSNGYGVEEWSRFHGLSYFGVGGGGLPLANNKLTQSYFLKKDNFLKQLLFDSENNILYVYNIFLELNLNFSVQLEMYNLSDETRRFAMLESVDTDYYDDYVPIFSLADNSGFFLKVKTETEEEKRFTMKLKDMRGNWLGDYSMYKAGTLEGKATDSDYTGVGAGKNVFGNDFSIPGQENKNYEEGHILVQKTDTAYELGAPYKNIPKDQALKTGYQIFAGNELPYMQIKADPEVWNVYPNYADEFETKYTLSNIPEPDSHGTVHITFSDNTGITKEFTGGPTQNFVSQVTIPRNTLPANLNEEQGTIKPYYTSFLAINETEGEYKGLPSEDYAVMINVYHLGGKAIAQSIREGSSWNFPDASRLIKDPVILPDHTASYEYVNGVPETEDWEAGIHYVKVRMKDNEDPNQVTIIDVPVNVTPNAPPSTGLTLDANDISISRSQLAGLDEDELKSFLIKESKAIAWDNSTGFQDGITISVANLGGLTNDPELGKETYEVTLQAAKSGSTSVTKKITVTIQSGMTAIPVEQTIPLGTDEAYWTADRLHDVVEQVTDGTNEITNYTVTLDEAPMTNRITIGTNTVSMEVTITDNDTQNNIKVSVPVKVTWGDSVALGGSGVSLAGGASTLALTLHSDETGPYLTSTYGDLPTAKEQTALGTAADTPYYQITFYDMDAKQAGQANATVVTDGVNPNATVSATGTQTPADLVSALPTAIGATDGKVRVKYGDILEIYSTQFDVAFYKANDGPNQPIAPLPNNDTAFVVVTEYGFQPLYLNHLDKKEVVFIPAESTESEATYNSFYDQTSTMFNIPDGVNNALYQYVKPDGYAKYPDLNLAMGDSSHGDVWVAEANLPTASAAQQKYLKYQYKDLLFTVKAPDLFISTPLSDLTFNTTTISKDKMEIPRNVAEWGFTVRDTRENKTQGWQVTARIENPFYAGQSELRGAQLHLKNESGETIVIDPQTGNQTIWTSDSPEVDTPIKWEASKGFYLSVPPGNIKADETYTTKVDFELQLTPQE